MELRTLSHTKILLIFSIVFRNHEVSEFLFHAGLQNAFKASIFVVIILFQFYQQILMH
jgi:hypothetical protein